MSASASIKLCDDAIKTVSAIRSKLGAAQNRLEHTIANLDNTAENLQSSESIIRDTDIAKAMVEYVKASILEQIGQAMLSQTNKVRITAFHNAYYPYLSYLLIFYDWLFLSSYILNFDMDFCMSSANPDRLSLEFAISFMDEVCSSIDAVASCVPAAFSSEIADRF